LSQWKTPTSPRPKKARQVRSNVKTMLIVFFDVRGIVPPGQTVNQEFYLEVLRQLRENVRRKRLGLWRSGDWFLHHDNAPPHTAVSVTRYLASLGWTVIPHPPYSLDLAPVISFYS
jgi:histone-lysine N-methyltransferase SETMAR